MCRVKNSDSWTCPNDSNVLIEKGELICGTVNKSIIGSNGGSLGHLITREYNASACADFLSSVQCMVNQWLIFNGFTVGVSDIIVSEKKISAGITGILKKFKREVSKIINLS